MIEQSGLQSGDLQNQLAEAMRKLQESEKSNGQLRGELQQ